MKYFNRYSLASLAALPLLGLSVAAQADTTLVTTNSTKVSISATVVDNTCEVDASTPWTLGNVKVSDIMNGVGGAIKPVTIALRNCGTGVTEIDVSATNETMDEQGLITNEARAQDSTLASNVKAQIQAGDNAKDSTQTLTPTTPVKFVENGDSPLKFNVKLLPVGSAKPTAGNFVANVALTLSYK